MPDGTRYDSIAPALSEATSLIPINILSRRPALLEASSGSCLAAYTESLDF